MPEPVPKPVPVSEPVPKPVPEPVLEPVPEPIPEPIVRNDKPQRQFGMFQQAVLKTPEKVLQEHIEQVTANANPAIAEALQMTI